MDKLKKEQKNLTDSRMDKLEACLENLNKNECNQLRMMFGEVNRRLQSLQERTVDLAGELRDKNQTILEQERIIREQRDVQIEADLRRSLAGLRKSHADFCQFMELDQKKDYYNSLASPRCSDGGWNLINDGYGVGGGNSLTPRGGFNLINDI